MRRRVRPQPADAPAAIGSSPWSDACRTDLGDRQAIDHGLHPSGYEVGGSISRENSGVAILLTGGQGCFSLKSNRFGNALEGKILVLSNDGHWSAGAAVGAAIVVALTACGGSPTETRAPTDLTVEIATDLPMQGAAAPQSVELVEAVKLYLEQVGYKAGRYTVKLRTYDDSTAAKGSWDDETCVKNAHEHLRSEEVAVVGTYNSGCARLEVPILNQGSDGPLLMVSHANTNPGLTTTWGPNEPEKFAPSGKKGFARVTPIDSIHGAAAAEYLKTTLGRKRCYIINDGGVYALGVAKAFTMAAAERGLKVAGNTTWDRGQKSYQRLFETIAATKADCLYIAGGFENNGGQLIKDKDAVLGDNRAVAMMAPDGMSGFPDLQAMPEAAGMYITAGGLPTDELLRTSAAAKTFGAAFKAKTGKDLASSYSLNGVAALQVVLAALEKSDGTRKGVNDAVFGSTDLSVPAAQSITNRALTIDHTTGDLISPELSITQIRQGKETFVSSQIVK